MAFSKSDMLDLLRQELLFLERGGYGGSQPWRAVSIFLDSPSCPNRLDPERSTPCQECYLFDFVPEISQQNPNPCHFIPLNADGESVYSMNRQYSATEVEHAVKNWLKREIRRLELEQQGNGNLTTGTN